MIKAKNLPTWPERIQAILKALNINAGELADLLNVTPATVSEWRTGKREPKGAAIRLLQLLERNPRALELIQNRTAF